MCYHGLRDAFDNLSKRCDHKQKILVDINLKFYFLTITKSYFLKIRDIKRDRESKTLRILH